MFNEDDGLDEDGNYLDIIQSPSYSYLKKRFKVRRLICRVCKLKFRTREETQAHIKREHRRIRQKHNEKDIAKPLLSHRCCESLQVLNRLPISKLVHVL